MSCCVTSIKILARRAALISAVQEKQDEQQLYVAAESGHRLLYAGHHVWFACSRQPHSTFVPPYFFTGLVWGEHDHPTAEPSREGSWSKSHCGRSCRYVVSAIHNIHLFKLCSWCTASTNLTVTQKWINLQQTGRLWRLQVTKQSNKHSQ